MGVFMYKYKVSIVFGLIFGSLNMVYAGILDNDLNNKNQSSFNSKQPEFLSEEQAFLFSARIIKKNVIEVKWGADEGYHLYHDKFSFEINNPNIKLKPYIIPPGKQTYIAVLGKTIEEHTGVFTMYLNIEGSGAFTLKAHGQGCADKGLCYPPFIREIPLKN